MKVSILLPYKENYSKNYAGAVSIFVNEINKKSKYKLSTKIFGNTNFKNYLSNNYINIPFKKKYFFSSSKMYVNNFIKLEKKRKSDIIEIHNRPSYLKYFDYFKKRIVFYFHNDPLTMTGSISIKERNFILNTCHKIIFNSEWTKKRFFVGLDNFYFNSEKIEVIYQSTNRKKININKKEKIITFVGKLNKSKGYDLFGKAITKILNDFKDWKAIVIGDEHREKIFFEHKRLVNMGYRSNEEVLKVYAKSSIAVACSRWEEPFGRSSLEASSRGCAVIISNRGGLPETITDGIILNKLTADNIYNNIKKLIINKKKLRDIQIRSFKNFYLDNEFIAKKIDRYRESFFKKINFNKKKLRILHVTNFNVRHNGRLFYNTGRRINNGLIKLGHTVQTLSDRDTVSQERKIIDLYGSKSLNNKFLDIVGNFNPNLIILGHADAISNISLEKIKNFYPSVKFCQWFLDKMDNNQWSINLDRFLKKMKYIDCSFCTTHPSSLKILKNKNVYFIPNPVDDTFENLEHFKNKTFKHDLFFALSHGVHRGILKKGKTDNREFFLKKLMKTSNEIRFNFFGIKDNQPIWAENFKRELSKSKMALNLSQGKPLKFYSSDRISQLIGNGILTFIDIKTKLNKIFQHDEVIFYKNINDLTKKIIKYKNSDKLRIKIAKKGMIKYHKHMSSIKISSYMISKTLNIKNKESFYWEGK